ncbi:hypothetical protein RRG08_034498 [Elysia crispata]|uniref:Uncharacterized protein n=1 Tax=Elysia crispata TaxID=231223 RepID=A0AAE1ECD6_9GAST|nr:hypothetical protein RRG08_034498 [Elysia crispata]
MKVSSLADQQRVYLVAIVYPIECWSPAGRKGVLEHQVDRSGVAAALLTGRASTGAPCQTHR